MKQAIFTMGLPACGKSTFVEKYFNNYNIIDPDKCEGNDHKEQVKNSIEKMIEAVTEKRSFVFLSTGGSNGFDATLDYLKKRNYYISIFYIKDSIRSCLYRNKNRERQVPDMKLLYKQIKKNIKICKNIVDEFITIKIEVK